MKNFALENWDDGRLTVNREFAETLRRGGLTDFDSFMFDERGEIAKNLLPERTTLRLSLPGRDGEPRDFYLKRHLPVPLKEYVKPWLRLTRPIVGARNEWDAILDFHQAGIPTMVPVAIGERGRKSFLLTEGIARCCKLSDWMETRLGENGSSAAADDELAAIVDGVAHVARLMHRQGLHHQDFYLTHLLLPVDNRRRGVHVIDLGRARRRRHLGRRWIVKDLAQLNYSAKLFPAWTRRRFLERYLDRPLQPSDRHLRRQIDRKSDRIARHSRKHSL